MKRAAFIVLVVPVLFFAASLTTPFEQIAQADRGGGRSGGGGSFISRGLSRGAGEAISSRGSRGTFVRSSDAVLRHSGRDGGVRHVGRGDFVRRGSFSHSHVSHGHHGHHGHFSTSIWLGPAWGWSVWDPFWYPYYYPYRYPYPYYSAPPSVVVPQEPEEYISSPQSSEQPAGYWYYCKEANGYYPYVKRCPSGWTKVVPYQPPPDLSDEGEVEED